MYTIGPLEIRLLQVSGGLMFFAFTSAMFYIMRTHQIKKWLLAIYVGILFGFGRGIEKIALGASPIEIIGSSLFFAIGGGILFWAMPFQILGPNTQEVPDKKV